MELMAFSVIAAGIICLITFFLTGSIHILHIWRLLVLQTQSRCHLKAWARVVGCALLYATSFVASILSIVWHSKQTRAEELITILLSISLESCYVSLIWLQLWTYLVIIDRRITEYHCAPLVIAFVGMVVEIAGDAAYIYIKTPHWVTLTSVAVGGLAFRSSMCILLEKTLKSVTKDQSKPARVRLQVFLSMEFMSMGVVVAKGIIAGLMTDRKIFFLISGFWSPLLSFLLAYFSFGNRIYKLWKNCTRRMMRIKCSSNSEPIWDGPEVRLASIEDLEKSVKLAENADSQHSDCTSVVRS